MSDIRKDYIKEFAEKNAWGLHVTIDAKGCNDFIKMEHKLLTFTHALCDIIDMKRYKECEIVLFGDDPKVCGYTLVQKIETSLVSGHFVNATNDACIDVFSCKAYDPYAVREFIKMFFKPRQVMMNVIYRG